jgi:hypothetical protein
VIHLKVMHLNAIECTQLKLTWCYDEECKTDNNPRKTLDNSLKCKFLEQKSNKSQFEAKQNIDDNSFASQKDCERFQFKSLLEVSLTESNKIKPDVFV